MGCSCEREEVKGKVQEGLLLVDKLPALLSNSLPPYNALSTEWDTVISRQFPRPVESGFFGLWRGVLFDPVLQTLVGTPGSRSCFGPSSPLSFSSADRTDGPTAQNSFFYRPVVVPSRRSAQREKISRMSRRGEIDELTVWMTVATVKGTLSSLSDPSFGSALRQAEGVGPPSSTSRPCEDVGHLGPRRGCVECRQASNRRSTWISLDGAGARTPGLTAVKIWKDAKDHTGSHNRSVGARHSSLSDEICGKCDKGASYEGDRQSGRMRIVGKRRCGG